MRLEEWESWAVAQGQVLELIWNSPSHIACTFVLGVYMVQLLSDAYLLPLRPSHFLVVRDVYVDAIESIGANLYTKEQIQSWASLALLPGLFDRPLEEGKGWVILVQEHVVAFALRYPSDRLALLYCRGHASRHGYATLLINQVELEAQKEGKQVLFAEATLFSYPLLLRYGWTLTSRERIEISGVDFCQYRMQKKLF